MKDEGRSCTLSIKNDEIIEQLNLKLRNVWQMTISALVDEFLHVVGTFIYTLVIEKVQKAQNVCNAHWPVQRVKNEQCRSV